MGREDNKCGNKTRDCQPVKCNNRYRHRQLRQKNGSDGQKNKNEEWITRGRKFLKGSKERDHGKNNFAVVENKEGN